MKNSHYYVRIDRLNPDDDHHHYNNHNDHHHFYGTYSIFTKIPT